MKKDKATIFPTVAVILAGFFSLLGIILRTLALFSAYNPTTGYYDAASDLPHAFTGVALGVIAVFTVTAFVARRDLAEPQWSLGLSGLTSSALFALSILVFIVSSLFELPAVTDPYLSTLTLFAVFFGVVSVFYFGRAILGMEAGREGLLPYLPVGLSLYAMLVAVMFYFDKSLAINNPSKNMHMLAFIALSLFALCETRYLLGRLKTPLAYVAVSLALFYTGSASLPNLFYSIASNRILAISTVYDFVLLAAFLYLLSRLLGMLPYRIPSVHPMVLVMAEREKEAEAATADALVEESVDTDRTPDAPAAPSKEELREKKKAEAAEKKAAEEAKKAAKKAAEEAEKAAKKASEEIKRAEKKAAEEAEKTAKKEAEEAKRAAEAQKKADKEAEKAKAKEAKQENKKTAKAPNTDSEK